MRNSNYGYSKKVTVAFEQAIENTKAALKKEGNSVLTEIDLKDTLKKRLM